MTLPEDAGSRHQPPPDIGALPLSATPKQLEGNGVPRDLVGLQVTQDVEQAQGWGKEGHEGCDSSQAAEKGVDAHSCF